ADTIGVNGWPIEAHVAGSVEFRWHRGEHPRGFHQLPYRMIVPRGIDNLFVAGRCASMTHEGQSSGRVTGPCFAMGEAAGTAADLMLSGGTTTANVDVAALQAALEKHGAYLGQDL
ncbi:MAG: FAD-dependent oxidoreductase, partial [Acidimicrobiales bacterium]